MKTYLGDIANDGLPRGFGCYVLKSGKRGRTLYREAGSMWRERSDTFTYLSRDGEYRGRRYLPADTEIEIVPLEVTP